MRRILRVRGAHFAPKKPAAKSGGLWCGAGYLRGGVCGSRKAFKIKIEPLYILFPIAVERSLAHMMIGGDPPKKMLAPNDIDGADDGGMTGKVHCVVFLEPNIELFERGDGKRVPLIQQVENLFLLRFDFCLSHTIEPLTPNSMTCGERQTAKIWQTQRDSSDNEIPTRQRMEKRIPDIGYPQVKAIANSSATANFRTRKKGGAEEAPPFLS